MFGFHCNSEVKQTQIYDVRLGTSNHKNNSQTKNKLPKQLVRSVGCQDGEQRVPLNLAILVYSCVVWKKKKQRTMYYVTNDADWEAQKDKITMN